MVRFTDKAREFWLEQSLDKGEMPKRDESKLVYSFEWIEVELPPRFFRPMLKVTLQEA